jgi:hypothetical protein
VFFAIGIKGDSMKLPNCNMAIIPIEKLRDYCLSETHPKGKHKAYVFQSVLGLTQAHAELFQAYLSQIVCESEAYLTLEDNYGQRYTIDFEMEHQAKVALIRSAWIIRTHEDFPRLATCFIL